MSELIKRTNRYLLPVFKRSWFIMLVTLVGCEGCHQFFMHMMAQAAENGAIAQLPSQLGELLTGLIEYCVLTLLIPQRVLELDEKRAPGSFWAFSFLHVGPLTVESIRALAWSIIWLFALVIPGIVKYVKYTFVMYIVVADRDYMAGKVDALKESERLSKGIFWPLLIFCVGSTYVDYLQSSLRESHNFLATPGFALAAALAFFAFNYYINILLFVLYQIRVEKNRAPAPLNPIKDSP